MKKSEIEDLKISSYNYVLPDEKIAKYPLEDRDGSKLLLYNDLELNTYPFKDIHRLLPENCLMIFNNTKVIHARLFFRKKTGALIEVFCLSPFEPSDYQICFQQRQRVVWNCMVGNSKKWKDDVLDLKVDMNGVEVVLNAKKISYLDGAVQVEFSWDNDSYTFSELLDVAGSLPIPPYLNRDSEASDDDTYQTIYSLVEGSVAAPTAGLHFTSDVMSLLRENGIKTNYVTLHVGAGTFKPVKSETISDHQMHSEYISIDRDTIVDLIDNVENIVVVGTTSTRTLESLYYIGKKILLNPKKHFASFTVSQWEPYESDEHDVSPKESLEAILSYMDRYGETKLFAETEIIIVPGYTFHYPKAIVTNFHQPQSTLLLLISAFVGDAWKEIYSYALKNDFRFLSYGDSSILFR